MLRFLRHYNRLLLGVFGLLLLFAWAVGGSLSQISNYAAREGATWATYGPKNSKVTYGELEGVQQELRVVEALEQMMQNKAQLLPVQGADRDPAHWYLLTKEAENAGLVGGEQDASPLLASIASRITPYLEDAGLEPNADSAAAFIASRASTNSHVVRKTIAKINGVYRLADLVTTIPHLSDNRLRHAAADTLAGVSCDIVVLDAHALKQPAVDDPTVADLEQQLKAYGEFEPGKGEKGFGYRLPNRVQLEWIQIAEAPIRAAIERSGALDSLTLKRKFAENPTKYGAPPEFTGDPLAAFPTYEQTVRQKVVDELVADRMKEIVKFASDHFSQSQRGLKRDGTGLYVLPDDWATRNPDLKALAAAIGDEFKIPAPVYLSTDQWQGPNDLAQLMGIGGTSTTQFGEKAIAFKDLVARAREFSSGDPTKPDAPLVQAQVATPPLAAQNKDVYFARITATDPARAPKSLDEAPPSLIEDVRAINRFAALAAMSSEIEKQAKDEGLLAVATRFDSKVEPVNDVREANPQFLSYGVKFPASLGSLQADADAVHAVIERASKMQAPVADLPAADRTFVIPLDKRLALVVVRVSDLTPLTSEDFETVAASPRAQMALAGSGAQGGLADTFSLDALTKRYNFKPIRKESDEEGANPKSAPTPAKAG